MFFIKKRAKLSASDKKRKKKIKKNKLYMSLNYIKVNIYFFG